MIEETPLFKITVQIKDKFEELLVHGYDQPEQLCNDFAIKHGLSEEDYDQLLAGVNSYIDILAVGGDESPEILVKTSHTSPASIKPSPGKRPSSHKIKVCSHDINPKVKILESATKRQRFNILTKCISPEKEVFLFKPQISKKY